MGKKGKKGPQTPQARRASKSYPKPSQSLSKVHSLRSNNSIPLGILLSKTETFLQSIQDILLKTFYEYENKDLTISKLKENTLKLKRKQKPKKSDGI